MSTTPMEQAALARLTAETDRLRHDVAALTREMERQSAIAESLWRVLQEQHGYDDAKLRAMVAAVMAARKPDPHAGAHAAPPCAKCGRPQARRVPRCLYCGAERVMDVFE